MLHLVETHPADLLPAFLVGRLTAKEDRDVRAHLAGCATCRAEVEELAVLRDMVETTHVATEQLVRFGLDLPLAPEDRIAVERHLADCDRCRAELELVTADAEREAERTAEILPYRPRLVASRTVATRTVASRTVASRTVASRTVATSPDAAPQATHPSLLKIAATLAALALSASLLLSTDLLTGPSADLASRPDVVRGVAAVTAPVDTLLETAETVAAPVVDGSTLLIDGFESGDLASWSKIVTSDADTRQGS